MSKRFHSLLLLLVVGAVFVLAGAPSALAASPWWHLTSRMIPAHLAPGGEATIVLYAINLGDASSAGNYTLSDRLPAGLSLKESHFYARPSKAIVEAKKLKLYSPLPDLGPDGELAADGYCKASSSGLSCGSESPLLGSVGELLLQSVVPYDLLEMRLKVKNEGAVSGVVNEFSMSGGGAPSAAGRRAVPVGGSAGFGVEEFTLVPEEEGGEADTRAGSHPYQLTSTLTFNRDSLDVFAPPAMPRDLSFKLPAGQVGNAVAVPQCSEQDFGHTLKEGVNLCPSDTAIGVAVEAAPTSPHGEEHFAVPVFNLRPAPGEPARFGFDVNKVPVILDTMLRSGPGEDYGVTVNVNNITQLVNFISSTVTFWGAPGDPSHNEARGWGCLDDGRYLDVTKKTNEELVLEGEAPGPELVCEGSSEAHPPAFLTLPTSCASPFDTTVEGVSWPQKKSAESPAEALRFAPVSYALQNTAGDPLSLDACNQLDFSPTVSAEPTAESASSPSGLNVNINFDDEGLTNAAGVAQSQLKDTTVALPEGLTINPSAGVGLTGCTVASYARETLESLEGDGCPGSSKLGTVEIESPLIKPVVHGNVYIAQPYENPFGSLVALYIVAKNPETGVLIKLAGKVTPNPLTGQLTTTFADNPQLPFNHFNFHFREGQQAPLITPATCREETPEHPGSYTTQALLAPWSDPAAVLTDASSFLITKGAEGGECPSGGAPPFNPQIAAGTLNNNAGSFSAFDLRLSRGDGDQEVSGFSTIMPEGLTGDLTGIPFCPDTDIEIARHKTGAQEEASPSCPAASEIGHTLVGTGVGAVLAYVPGRLYLAGPFQGAPFSLVSVTSAKVGPFDLGTVVLRFGLNIDPYTAKVSVEPSSSESIPTIIDGIVTHVRDIRVYVDRPNFIINPTSCNPLSIASTLSAHEGASATVTSPFQATNCASLKFAPQFTVSTSAKTSKANGASLHVSLAYPNAPQGTYADIAKVKVELPEQLPSRLTTLQKACTAAQFEANPAGCPGPSVIGVAKAVVPNIPEPLTGPVYFVSHGGEAFPSLEIVLQGYGVRVILVGSTFISKAGVTSTTFKAIPDNPVTSFELTLPEGQYSALTANGNLCTQKLVMPVDFTAQNGMEDNYKTTLTVTGCPKKKTLTLTALLKACRKKDKSKKHKREMCERAARKRFMTKQAKKAGK